jgi:hypothetical protein
MKIIGIITQGRTTTQFVQKFTVNFRQGINYTTGTDIMHTFSAQDHFKTEHMFDTPVLARYIRINIMAQSKVKAMRVGLITQSCSKCVSKSSSLQNSSSANACQCIPGSHIYYPTFSQRAFALVPGRAQISTFAKRTSYSYASTADFSKTAGINGNTAITFDGALQQYIDSGPHTFNIKSNGGFTAIALVRFPNNLNNQSILDFGNGADNYNIVLRKSTSTIYVFEFYDPGNRCYVSITTPPKNSNWILFLGRYDEIDNTMEISVDGQNLFQKCSYQPSDRSVSKTYIGRSHLNSDPYSTMNIAGFYAVDAYLNNTQIADITANMYTGQDTLQICSACLHGSFSTESNSMQCTLCHGNATTLEIATADNTSCVCNAGFSEMEKTQCARCVAGTYNPTIGSACSKCPAGTFSADIGSMSISSCSPCQKGTYNEIQGGGSSASCLSCAAGKFHRKLGAASKSDCKECTCRK